ncbi:MAG TPA: PqqD family protein [Gemmatimonadales bacterium]|nr:PqqD family protein [Gemmatimonadales bacterium]
MPFITPQSRLVRSPIPPAEVREDAIVWVDDQGRPFLELKGTERRVWELLDEPHSLDTLVAALGMEFDIPAGELGRVVTPALQALWKWGLLEVDGG